MTSQETKERINKKGKNSDNGLTITILNKVPDFLQFYK